ncbi:hypothetical protein T261_0467 [Streptomyces lydicus]|nr:hypothetical protein T261_0467 [Streptomyces lydicus]
MAGCGPCRSRTVAGPHRPPVIGPAPATKNPRTELTAGVFPCVYWALVHLE